MIDVLLLRHARTPWNLVQRIQGHRDIALDELGRAELAGCRIPRQFADFEHYASPLRRARQTAGLLGMPRPRIDARLMELDWGQWVGCTRTQLRARDPDALLRNEALGLDFRPPGGESPRELKARLADWLAHVAARGRPVIAVTHKGVIQMALALATGWDLVSRAPYRLDWRCLQHFVMRDARGGLDLVRVNVSLELSAGDGSRECRPGAGG